jgi:hypothetical protein
MAASTPRRRIIVALGAAMLVVAATGVAFAASARPHGAKACVRSNGYLALASANGKCPAHAKRVTLGKQGKTGPSHGYIDTQATALSLDSTPTVASLTLPAGSYLFTGIVQLENSNTSAAVPIVCKLINGSKGTAAYVTTVPAGEMIFTVSIPGEATAMVTGAGHFAAGTTALACDDVATTGAQAFGSLSAQLVGSLSSTGSPSFS